MAIVALHVSLADGTTRAETLPPDVEQRYLGGRGAATWLLARDVPSTTGPLSPANRLIVSAGPLAGRLASAAGGFLLTTRSPLSDTIAHSWGLGGAGAALQQCGYDLLSLSERAPEWSVLLLDAGKATLRPAGALLGLDTVVTAATLRQELGDGWHILCVGPAGEAGVAYASVVADGTYPAEPAGTGAVLSHKRIKAIAIRGAQPIPCSDQRRVDAVLAGLRRRLDTNQLAAAIRQYGSLTMLPHAEQRGAITGLNGSTSTPDPFALTRDVFANRGKREPRGCVGCPLACHSTYLRKSGEPLAYPEFEAVAGFGGSCGVTNPDTVIILNDLCLRLGLDVGETAAALAFMTECQKEGLALRGTLSWGDGDALLAAVRRLGQKQEKRDIVSLGVGEMHEVYYGSTSYAPQVKGLAMPAIEPRALSATALALATAPIGGDHRYAMIYEELLGEVPAWLPNDQASQGAIRGPAPRLIWYERYAAALDAAGICRRLALLAQQLAPAEAAELIAGATGRSFSPVELALLGERIVTLERLLSRSYGATRDWLPRRWASVELDDGPAAGKLVPLDSLIAEYYQRHAWDEHGAPTAARLAELGISLPS